MGSRLEREAAVVTGASSVLSGAQSTATRRARSSVSVLRFPSYPSSRADLRTSEQIIAAPSRAKANATARTLLNINALCPASSPPHWCDPSSTTRA